MRGFESYEWTPMHDGHSGVPTFRLTAPGRQPLFAKRLARSQTSVRSDLVREGARIEWLAKQGVPSPELVDAGVDDDVQWLVMTEVPGRSGAHSWPAHQRDAVVDAIADALHVLHALPIGGCPFDHGLSVMSKLPGAAALSSVWPAYEDPVVCHGDYCLPNVYLDPETLELTGFIDLGGLGIADRYMDLALAGMSIGSDELNPQYDAKHVDRFFDRYGADPADARRECYLRLSELF